MRYRKVRQWMMKRIHQQWPDAPISFWNLRLHEDRKALQQYLSYKWSDKCSAEMLNVHCHINFNYFQWLKSLYEGNVW